MSENVVHLMAQDERISHMFNMCEIVRLTAAAVLKMKREEMHDTVEVDKHVFSGVDAVAGAHLRSLASSHMPSFSGHLMEECDIARAMRDHEELRYPLLICDAVEGSTNAKRGLASIVRRPIFAGTSMVLIENKRMSTVAASAFYDFASGHVFSSIRGEHRSFLSFIDGTLQQPEGKILEQCGDSKPWAVVAAYSNDNVKCVSEITTAIQLAGIRTHGGSRSSAQDLLEIVCNQVDAYIDLRALFPGNTDSRDETLHFWDVGGLLPFLQGLGFAICDQRDRPWQEFTLDEGLALIACRPILKPKILDAIGKLTFVIEPHAPPSIISIAGGAI